MKFSSPEEEEVQLQIEKDGEIKNITTRFNWLKIYDLADAKDNFKLQAINDQIKKLNRSRSPKKKKKKKINQNFDQYTRRKTVLPGSHQGGQPLNLNLNSSNRKNEAPVPKSKSIVNPKLSAVKLMKQLSNNNLGLLFNPNLEEKQPSSRRESNTGQEQNDTVNSPRSDSFDGPQRKPTLRKQSTLKRQPTLKQDSDSDEEFDKWNA